MEKQTNRKAEYHESFNKLYRFYCKWKNYVFSVLRNKSLVKPYENVESIDQIVSNLLAQNHKK